jgi:hypothetical protein
MASRTLPGGVALKGFWALGEDGWKDEMDANLRIMSALLQGRALTLASALPGSPADGDIHLLDEAVGGGDANKVAIRDNGAWVKIAPVSGWVMFDVATGVHRIYNGTIWAVLGGRIVPETVAGTAYTIVMHDIGKHKRCTNGSATAITIPLNSTTAFPIGTRIRFTAAGAGTVTLTPAGGVTLRSRGASLASAGQYAVFEIEKVAADEWDCLGDLA